MKWSAIDKLRFEIRQRMMYPKSNRAIIYLNSTVKIGVLYLSKWLADMRGMGRSGVASWDFMRWKI